MKGTLLWPTEQCISQPGSTLRATGMQRLCRTLVFSRFRRMTRGRLTVNDPLGSIIFGDRNAPAPFEGIIHVMDMALYPALALGGSIAAGESWMKHMWHSPDLTGALRLFALNHEALKAFDRGWSKIASPFQRLMHLARRNTTRGSVRNIHSHYDLGNEFFSLFLDPTMTYSCALFMDGSMSLEEAQRAKIERICRKLSLERRHRVLEIGGGWGSFALHAARSYGCTVTALTLSREQFEYMCRQVREAGLEEKVTVLLEDYRAIRGCYDRIVSIEMIEAIGYQQLDEFFRRTSSLLTSDGLMAIQAITMLDSRFEAQKASVDFIKLHIFPGSCLVSLAALQHSVARRTDLRLIHLEDITPHYAATLRIWREKLLAQRELLLDRGFTDEFIRKWEFYFSFCEAGFAERSIGDVQIVYAKPLSRQKPLLGDF